MRRIKIYSPPIITAKGKIKIGHGANLVWCDVLARSMSYQNFSIDYFFPSWNHQGKMFDGIANDDNLELTLKKIESELENKLSFFGLENHSKYIDSSEESRENARDKFNELLKKNFIDFDGQSYGLRIDKIKEKTGLIDHISDANFFPYGAKKRMLDLVRTLDGRYPITKPREFATPLTENENSTQKINPIFDLAVSPLLLSKEPVDYSIGGIRTMLRGAFIPFVIWAGLYDLPFSKNVATHGYLLSNLESKQDVGEFFLKTNQDVLRGSAILCTNSLGDTILNESRAKKIIKGTSKLVKLAWFFKDFDINPDILNQPPSQYLTNEIEKMHHFFAMENIINGVLSLSGRMSENKLTRDDIPEYLSFLNDSKIFFPVSYERAVNVLTRKDREF